MKKIVFLLIGLTLATMVSAQGKSFKIGIKLSPGVGFLRTDVGDIATNGRPMRLGYGLIFDRMFSENYALGFGLNMIEFGGHAEYTNVFSDSQSDPTIQYVRRDYDKVKYIEMPLTLKLRTAMIGKMMYWGQFGVGLGYLFSGFADEKTSNLYVQSNSTENGPFERTFESSESIDDKLDIKSELSPFRVSMIVAAGAEYPISGSTYLSYGITYNGGILSMYRNGDKVIKYKDGAVAFNSDMSAPVLVEKKVLLSQVQLNVGIIF